ncbi:MAG: DUF1573 domain-containing protein, partial [Bacteroidota bacterium]
LAFAAGTVSAQSTFLMPGEQKSLTLEKAPVKVEAQWGEAVHDFGPITQGTPVTHRFEFTNEGTQAVKIERVKPSCGCTAANYSKTAVAPGETGFVEATYNAAAAGTFNKSITVFFEGDTQPTLLRFKGEVNAEN